MFPIFLTLTTRQVRVKRCHAAGRWRSEMGIDLAGGFADSPRTAGQSLHLAIV
jgi:hypothetical protein